ncbi:altronate dehydratase family protein [Algoriphagus sp. CAU 1675]|uniref:UxaA family hydrolase n=1 Tax=Algoriphagus sp. CAU 1675 TaxID=3032597 RepID=UPI0023DC7EB0|nr:altronate dehydratase family protein [Algoriphagus sp. CAU 1675]MDF2158008.1 altronate dehydratase family protein [Algoriphagus sp. CAU 1675]
MINKSLCLDPADNVGVALTDLEQGETLNLQGKTITLREPVSAKHKFALQDFNPEDSILMYGTIVGEATRFIAQGEAITLSNIRHKTRDYIRNTRKYHWTPPNVSKWKTRTFMGYKRQDGQVGTANYWLVLPLVFCENTNVLLLQEAFEKALGFSSPNPYEAQILELVASFQQSKRKEITESVSDSQKKDKKIFENLDGIRFLTHQGGCGGTRQDAESLCALLAGYIHHPNVAGATVLSLGCQNAQVDILKEKLNLLEVNNNKPLIICEQQQEGTTDQLIQKAIRETFEGLVEANKIKREPAPLSKLVIGLECGGSDGFSGISANPTLGRVSDLVVASGGSAILSEFPELCGAEQNLIDRCETEESATKFIHLMEAYSKAAEQVGSGFDMNPSPGNIKDGLLTDAIKSCGAAKKGGTAPVSDVLDYTEYLKTPGLNLLCTPGNDVESTTGLAGSGANIILFTTGLGTPTGNPISPVIKVSTNTKLAQRMPDIIDFNTGGIISGDETIESSGEKLLELVIQVASGEVQAKADKNRNFDFIPWKRGVSL